MSIWIKICGIRDVATARAVAALGPDAIGLNFYAGSPRAVSLETAAEIVGILPGAVVPIGVFVNHSAEEVRSICQRVELATVQIHGDESAGMIAQLGDLRIIRAFRIGRDELSDVAASIGEIAATRVRLAGCLVDAHVAGAYGGTGQSPPWRLLADGWDRDNWPPMILAGGLTPENVADGIHAVRPWGVDVASGVESVPGQKDLERVRRFIATARAAANGSGIEEPVSDAKRREEKHRR
jgi:phosphoribosylanthranilate isomerase